LSKKLPYMDSKCDPVHAQQRIRQTLIKFGVDRIAFDEDFKAAKEVLEDYEMDTGMKAQWLWNFIEATVDDLPEE